MKIRDKIRQYPWAADILDNLRKEFDPMLSAEPAIPHEPGGWWHNYVCPEHHTELLFDSTEQDARAFYCPYGCKLEGEPYRGAWLVFKHQAFARHALQAAALYAGTGDVRYAAWGSSILLRYAAQFPRYPVHPQAEAWMLRGHAFHQALTEAIWATTLIRAYLLLVDEGFIFGETEKGELDTFFSTLEESLTQARIILTEVKKEPQSNYTAWLNAALACLCAWRKDSSRMQQLIEGPAGLIQHLTIGVKPDQMEYEGSTYYHVFVLRAYFILVEMAQRFDMDLRHVQGEQGQSLEGMLDVLAALANEQGELPALHDGPYQRVPYAREIAETVEIGLSHYRKMNYVPVLKEAYRQLSGMPKREGLEALLYGEGDLDSDVEGSTRTSALFEPSGFVVGRRPNGLLAFYSDFGAHGGSHGHFDKLHLTMGGRDGWFAPELGIVPYGSRMRQEWYASTASHNTVLINNRSQAPHTGELVHFEETDRLINVCLRSREAYPGCTLNRHLLLSNEWLLDWFLVELDIDASIDWWMHSPHLTPAGQQVQWSPFHEPLAEEGPYTYVRPFAEWKGSSDDICKLEMSGTSGSGVALSTLASPSSRFLLAETPGTADDPAKSMRGLLHRQYGHRASFVTVYNDASVPVKFSRKDSGDTSSASIIELLCPNAEWRAELHPEKGILLYND